MADLDSWKTDLEHKTAGKNLKERVEIIKFDLEKINQFMQNPFKNKSLTSERRKQLWEKAARKKELLEKELSKSLKTLKLIADEEKKKARKR